MISIVVCSIDSKLYYSFENNISATVGVDYEIIRIDNNVEKLSICKAYNKGAKLAKYDVLIFIHEDVIFKTPNWGQLLMYHFYSLENIGIVGLLGSVFKTKALSTWWQESIEGFDPRRTKFIQSHKYSNLPIYNVEHNPNNELFSEVVCLDGVFLSMKKNIWQQTPFDESLLTGFHGYDLDISLSVNNKFKNYVVFDILIEHLSEGKYDESWFVEMIKVHFKHIKNLPIISRQYKNLLLDFSVPNINSIPLQFGNMISIKLSLLKFIRYSKQIIQLADDNYKTNPKYSTLWLIKYFIASRLYNDYPILYKWLVIK